jgi:hypothetical protein
MIYSTLLKTACRTFYGEPPAPPADREGAGLVVVADGVGGLDLCGTVLRYVVPEAGLPHEVRVAAWGHGFGRWHADLTNAENVRAKAAAVAAEVALFRAEHPAAPVFLVGKSGGTGVVVKALEGLPPGAVERAVLLAPALSPAYDLRRALAAVGRELVVFWSPLDLIVLGLGTRIFGTIDRINAVSAGLVGFRAPGDLDGPGRAHYAKLRQVRWRPGMARTGYLGGTSGPTPRRSSARTSSPC